MLLNEAILSRHSTRSFRPAPVDRALLFTLADAAQQAPSASNLQAWRFLFITDPQLKEKVDLTYEEGPGNHEWDFWDRYILKILDWLPLNKKDEGLNSGHVSK